MNPAIPRSTSVGIVLSLCATLLLVPYGRAVEVAASSVAPGFETTGALDGERFSTDASHAWQGAAGAGEWWWQTRFDAPREIGAILQITGDHGFVLRNAPRDYTWRWSEDGTQWRNLDSTAITRERRTFRLHRLANPVWAKFLRLTITATHGVAPTLREVEFFAKAQGAVNFPDWVVAVNTTDDPKLPSHGQEFIPLARSCKGWEELQAQQVWIGDFDENYLSAEPRPMCAFLSGNFKDWCQIAREPWRGLQGILQNGTLPIWASCGGAQGLALLAEVGVDKPWDCPHCRDPRTPKSPIYTHIGHTGTRACGDYSACIFERGPHLVKQIGNDPVFQDFPEEFAVMESHCGQIEWPPKGWELIATAGAGTLTKTQCLRLKDRCIYAAQFHIEMEGTPQTSRAIMSNFLHLAKRHAQ